MGKHFEIKKIEMPHPGLHLLGQGLNRELGSMKLYCWKA